MLQQTCTVLQIKVPTHSDYESLFYFYLFLTVLLLDPNGKLCLSNEMKWKLKKMNGQDKKSILKAHFLNISPQAETESLALCIALSYELIFEFISNPMGVFSNFINCRNHLYGCLKVIINHFWIYSFSKYYRTTNWRNFQKICSIHQRKFLLHLSFRHQHVVCRHKINNI